MSETTPMSPAGTEVEPRAPRSRALPATAIELGVAFLGTVVIAVLINALQSAEYGFDRPFADILLFSLFGLVTSPFLIWLVIALVANLLLRNRDGRVRLAVNAGSAILLTAANLLLVVLAGAAVDFPLSTIGLPIGFAVAAIGGSLLAHGVIHRRPLSSRPAPAAPTEAAATPLALALEAVLGVVLTALALLGAVSLYFAAVGTPLAWDGVVESIAHYLGFFTIGLIVWVVSIAVGAFRLRRAGATRRYWWNVMSVLVATLIAVIVSIGMLAVQGALGGMGMLLPMITGTVGFAVTLAAAVGMALSHLVLARLWRSRDDAPTRA